jgi:hypothetical protein
MFQDITIFPTMSEITNVEWLSETDNRPLAVIKMAQVHHHSSQKIKEPVLIYNYSSPTF